MQSDEEASLNGDESSDSEDEQADAANTSSAGKHGKKDAANASAAKRTKSNANNSTEKAHAPTWNARIRSCKDPAVGLKVATADMVWLFELFVDRILIRLLSTCRASPC